MAGWTREAVYHDGDDYFRALQVEIAASRESVDLEVYIFHKDRFGEPILKLLAEAARRGVRVRLMVDGFGSAGLDYDDFAVLREAGAKTAFYHPLPWQRLRYPGLGLRRLRVGLARLNQRNHRKTCLIDGRVAFVGGMNISEVHLASARGAKAWRDTTVRVEGEAVAILTRAFDRAWRETERAVAVGDAPVRLGLTRGQRESDYAELVERVLRARERVWIANPYFVPGLSLLRALRFAAWAKVDVRLIVPSRSDVWPMNWAVRAFYRALLGAGVRVHEHGPAFLHAKTILVDDWARVGSSNLNQRSLFHDLEADVILEREESIASLRKRFDADLRSSREVSLRRAWKRSFAQRFIEKVVLIFRRWL
jgi:cardiolipin synthase